MDQLQACPYCGSASIEFTDDWKESKWSGHLLPGWAVLCKGCCRLGPYGGNKSEAAWEWNNLSSTIAHDSKQR